MPQDLETGHFGTELASDQPSSVLIQIADAANPKSVSDRWKTNGLTVHPNSMSDLSKAWGETETCHEPVPNCESTMNHDSGTGLASDRPSSVLIQIAFATNPKSV